MRPNRRREEIFTRFWIYIDYMKYIKLFKESIDEDGYEEISPDEYWDLERKGVDIKKSEFKEVERIFDPIINIDVLKDPQFIRNITQMIHVETQKVVTGGKVKG